ncbi:MAG: hypothetical protein ABJA67_02180 [Chthonomonadales bacterium]
MSIASISTTDTDVIKLETSGAREYLSIHDSFSAAHCILFTSTNVMPCTISAIDALTGGSKVIFSSDVVIASAITSTSGKYIAAIEPKSKPRKLRLFSKSGQPIKILPGDKNNVLDYCWSRTKDVIYFLAENPGKSELFRYDVESKKLTKLFSTSEVFATFDVSPNGVIALDLLTKSRECEIAIVNGASGEVIQKSPDGFYFHPSWSRDGKYLAHAVAVSKEFPNGYVIRPVRGGKVMWNEVVH